MNTQIMTSNSYLSLSRREVHGDVAGGRQTGQWNRGHSGRNVLRGQLHQRQADG